MLPNYFVYGEPGSGMDIFPWRYDTKNLVTIPHGRWGWIKVYNSFKWKITEDTIFLWNRFEDCKKITLYHYSKLIVLEPNHQHIITSSHPPSYYSEEIQEFLKENKFQPIHLKDNTTTPRKVVKEHIDDLIRILKS